MFDIEITTRCNKQCYICPRQNFKRVNRDMSNKVFETLYDWLPKDCDVFFAGYGEPLLHKNHLNFMHKLLQKNIRISILTNGKLLTKSKICELYEQGLYKLQISILARDELNIIDDYVDMVDKKYRGKTQFNLLYDETINNINDIIINLKKMEFKVYEKHIHSRGGELYKNPAKNHSSELCGTFLNVHYIDTEGYIQICSNDINGKYNLEHISNLSFEELINKKREIFGNCKIFPICEQCDDEYRLLHLQKMGVKQ